MDQLPCFSSPSFIIYTIKRLNIKGGTNTRLGPCFGFAVAIHALNLIITGSTYVSLKNMKYRSKISMNMELQRTDSESLMNCIFSSNAVSLIDS